VAADAIWQMAVRRAPESIHKEKTMKKTYASPQLTTSGSVVGETLGQGVLSPREAGPAYKPIVTASVGFYL
jgi:hypothetical protein